MANKELFCHDCEYLHAMAIKTGNTIDMFCEKFDIKLERRDYSKDAYRCYVCRNGGQSGT